MLFLSHLPEKYRIELRSCGGKGLLWNSFPVTTRTQTEPVHGGVSHYYLVYARRCVYARCPGTRLACRSGATYCCCGGAGPGPACRPGSWSPSRWTSCPGCRAAGSRRGRTRSATASGPACACARAGSWAWSACASSEWSSCRACQERIDVSVSHTDQI